MPRPQNNNQSFQRRPVGWCPSCNKTQSCSRSQESDALGNGSYSCDECGGVTHEPLIRLLVPFRDSGIVAEGF
jgi:predicted RNA-binding Zn-ribbon protein involved in translation (DUF1610 family)